MDGRAVEVMVSVSGRGRYTRLPSSRHEPRPSVASSILPTLTMFLTTGRCGTQWLTATLSELYPHLRVEHEPIGPLYAPRRHFRRWEQPERILEEPAVAEHLQAILSEDTDYVETGWPLR